MSEVTIQPPSHYYACPAWQAVTVVGGHSHERTNAQIAISILGVSIVPERPRLLVGLWKSNLTHDFVRDSGTLSLGLLAEDGVALIPQLGLYSGRERDKVSPLDMARTVHGDPYPACAVGVSACRVLDAMDMGDSTAFLVAVESEQRLRADDPLTWQRAQELLSESVMASYERKFEEDACRARQTMKWL